MNPQALVDHWVKYMPIQPEYIADAIKRHFKASPWDEAFMRPQLEAAFKTLKEKR